MKVEKLDGKWAVVDVPAEAIEALRLRDGDEVAWHIIDSKVEISKSETLDDAIARMRAARRVLPEGWKFDRQEANRRGPE